MDFSFRKKEKLKSRKSIEALFSEGRSVLNYPVKLYYLPINKDDTNQAAFAVPKRNFKKAVTRNKVKRQMREAYRLHKHMLTANNGLNFALLFLYIGKEVRQYVELESSMRALIKRLKDETC